jgi:hypothetical protein
MHRIGNSSKWQVANNEIRLSPASIRDSDICFARMPRQVNDRKLVLLRRSGSRTGAAVVGVIVVTAAAIRLGVASEYLEWLPQAEEVFASRRGGYHWTTVHLAGTIEQPQQDLSPRIIDALKEWPAAFLALVFRQVGEWLKDAFGGE